MERFVVSRRTIGLSAAAGAIAMMTMVCVVFASSPDGRTTSVNASYTEAGRSSTVQGARPQQQASEYAPGELIVKFKPGMSGLARVAVIAGEGAQPARDLLTPRYSLVKVPEGREDEFLTRLAENPHVELVERNAIAQAAFIPDDQYYYRQWDMPQVQMPAAWDVADGSGVTVAVIDTGVAYEDYSIYAQAPDLEGTCFRPGYDFVKENHDSHANDDYGHGTHVAGTIAQTTDNGVGVAGVAPGACIMPIKVLDSSGSGTQADVSDGIRWATDHDANVINLSMEGGHLSVLEDAIDYAISSGVVVVAAAGNGGTNRIQCPACYPSVIAVGATDYNKNRSYYSNYGCSAQGGCLDIVAPGGDTRVDHNGDGYPDGILQQTFNFTCDPRAPNDYTAFVYCLLQGTSMATPHVAGVAALLLSANPALSVVETTNCLTSTALDRGAPGWDEEYGYGFLQARAALDSCAALIPTPTATPTQTPTSTPTPTPVPTDTPTPTSTPTITPTPTNSPTPTATPNTDTDSDSILDHLDNCPLIANPPTANGLDDDDDCTIDEASEQVNTDHASFDNGPDVVSCDVTVPMSDSLGDACDEDTDNDWMLSTGTSPLGVPGEDAGCNGSGPTNPLVADSDGDMVLDGAECLLGTNPNNPASKPSGIPPGDSDRDGLPATVDALFCDADYDGDTLVGDADQDCDNDGLSDGLEVRGWGTSPSLSDSDGDLCDDDKEVADINGDRYVSILDPYLVAQLVFGIVPTHPIADLNRDGAYTVLDALLAARNSVLMEPHTVCPQR
jgi:serine protease